MEVNEIMTKVGLLKVGNIIETNSRFGVDTFLNKEKHYKVYKIFKRVNRDPSISIGIRADDLTEGASYPYLLDHIIKISPDKIVSWKRRLNESI